MKKLFNNFILIAGILLYSANAAAVCVANPSGPSAMSSFIPDETLYVQYDDTAPIIKTYEIISVSSSYNFATTVTNTCNASFIIRWQLTNWPGGSGNTRISNIPGVGLDVTANYSRNPGDGIQSHPLEYFFNNATMSQMFRYFSWTVKITRTGQVTQSGIMRPNIIAEAFMYNYPQGVTPFQSRVIAISFKNNFRIVPLSCSLKNTSSTLNINMGDWFDAQFKAIGSTSTQVAIPITLNCLAGTNIKVLVTSSSYVDTTTGKIGLSGDDKATGIAIQLLDKNDTPIELNKKISIANIVPVGDYALNWKARYIKTADKITAGSANASATVNIIYE